MSKNTKLFGTYLLAGSVISYGLFLFMGHLVSLDGDFKPDGNDVYIDFARVKFDSDADTKERKRPEKPPTPEEPKDMEKIEISNNEVSKPQMSMNIPKLSLSSVDSGGPFLGKGGAAASGDGDALPIVRIEPVHPRKAAMNGIEGYVIIKFDITPQGSVSNVKVVGSKPRKIFDKAAKRAIRKWRYKPKVIDGKAVAQVGQKVQIDFKLQK